MSKKKKTETCLAWKKRTSKKVISVAMIPLDTAKIRKELLKVYQRRKKVLERIEAQLQQHNENDEPLFHKFLAQRFGSEQSRLREFAEKIHLVQMRREKIRYMANEEGMSQGRYCFYLEEKVDAETDFWTVLENEIRAMQEEQRLLDEEFERYCRECDEEDGFDDDDDDISFLDEDEDDFEGFADEFEDVFGKGSKEIFEQLFGDIFPGERKRPEKDHKDLKKLYRELCFRHHPDKVGEHDQKTQRLWLSIQNAYQTGDLERLRAIHAGIAIESGNAGAELICSDIDAMIGDIEWSIHSSRGELRAKKRVPYWGFSTWTEKQQQKAERELSEVFNNDLELAERELRQYEAELERIRKSYKPKKKKQNPNSAIQPDLFQMDLPL